MKKKSIYLFLFIFVHIHVTYAQQIITDNFQQPNELIQSLVGNDCATVSNVSSSINGSINNIVSYGSFSSSSSNFPFQNGLILSTGSVTSAGNTFMGENLSEGEIDWVTDSDVLDVLGIDQTLNATSIEFDFNSANNFVAFKYLFASEEYQQEFPCNFKDVFAILIKRAGTTDPYVNIAVVPETITEVSTNTIHTNINGFCDAENEDFFQGYNLGDTNFNGNTTVLTATSAIIPNETYHIKFIIADHIDERFDSAVFIEAGGFGSSVDLGPDQSICGSDLILDANINNNTAVYSWFLNGSQIASENNPTLAVNQSGTYDVEIAITSPSGNCVMTDSIEIDIIPFQNADPIADVLICDRAPSDGIYEFDFPFLKNDEIFNNLPSNNYNISYHLSEEDAENNDNPIIGSYQNTESEETIFVRIESIDGSCLQIGRFNTIINAAPNTRIIDPIIVCEELYIPAFNSVDFDFYDFWVANFEFNRTVTFHFTEEEAEIGENAIPSPYPYPDQTEVLYARVVDDFNGCHSVVPFTMEFNESPFIGVDRYIINKCTPIDENYDQAEEIFNLNDAVDEISDWLSEPRVNFFPSAEDALSQTNAYLFVDDPIFTLTSPQLTIYMAVAEQGGYCTSIVPLELHKNVTNNVIGEDTVVKRCDDQSNDGIFDFDLNNVTEELIGGYGDLTLTYYQTFEDQQNNTNVLDPNTILTVNNPTTELFLKVKYKNECEDFTSVMLQLNELPTLEPVTADACGNFNLSDSTTSINVRNYKDLMIQNTPFPLVKFYESYEDADNDENVINETYDVANNSHQFFARVTNTDTGCYSITTLDINVVQSLNFQSPEPIIICDDDQNGFTTMNLFSVLPSISTELDEFTIQFYTTYTDAYGDRDVITNPQNYNAQTQEIFARIERPSLNCFAIIDFEIRVFNNPQIEAIPDYINCQLSASDSANFSFENRDASIINGQIGMQVMYFESELDAISNSNAIDKTIPYQNITNPQTIYVRMENENQNSCVAIAPMQIVARQAPIYNVPTDIPVCGTNGDGPYQIDLNTKIDEISNGSPNDLGISFHTTELNANFGTNPTSLSFTSTSNPEKLYVRILNNDSGCFNVESFYINILDLPEVKFNQSLIQCSNYFNTQSEWDLTDIELDILDGRQYNIDFTYYQTELDAENEVNVITNPENYIGANDNEMIYVKLINLSTGCYIIVPFELILNNPPQLNTTDTYDICENELNSVNLLDINEVILDDTFNIIVSYHANQDDAEANENALNTDYNYTNMIETLFVRLEYSTTHCYVVSPFQLVVNPLPIANTPNNLMACDDDFDGLVEFDLNTQNADILNGQNTNDFSLTYHNSENDAVENMLPLNTNYTANNNEIIFARVENNTTGCFDITQFSIIVNPLPLVAIEDQVICLNNVPLHVSADTNNTSDTYLWSTNETSPEIQIYTTGAYSVTITNEFGCETTSTFNVTESESATIDVVETIDFSDPNNITVTVNGIGNYLYQLDNFQPQESNVFYNVSMGYHTVRIIDVNGCADITKQVLVVDIPKFFTPNGDGDFDTWHIVGIETLPGTTINIFDRYGKLLVQLKSSTPGWNGYFNGNKMLPDDYWYVADIKRGNESFQIKGHFTLRL
ncbi:choice-of-anchor L domain-containing protein [uncultured Winogradskyella sp.]|uniref:T9SS type B sorting domain-containing protein n=1 Tax=uncultured Winogradskyella sp. TaxID=395353 RepID=UPI00262FA18B|nr:choice-of-anchor L domain-containing protein [uncultured Winogradskyella sp.]